MGAGQDTALIHPNHMTTKKKKTVENPLAGYMPANYSPTITSNEIKFIPPYDDVGVSFKGYSKTLKGDGTYDLNPQIRRLQNAALGGTVSTSVSGARADPNKRFYCAAATIGFKCTTAQTSCAIYDGSNNQAPLKFFFYMPSGQNYFTFDFSNCPRDFLSPNIYLELSNVLGSASDFVHVALIGWAE